MDNLTRKVIARYREDFNEKSPDEGKSWMDYVHDKNVSPLPSETAVKLLETAKGFGKDSPIYNPYDYKDPSDKPKDPKGSPFVNNVLPTIDHGLFTKPELFVDQGVFEEWLQSQRQDATENEQEQYPALSLTCKYSSIQNVIARHFLNVHGIHIAETEFSDLFRTAKVAATMSEIINKDYHYLNNLKMQRSDAVTVLWANKNNQKEREKGFFIFKASSPGSKHGTHTIYLQFLRGEEEKQYASYAEYPVQLACTCDSFLYHGAQYYAVHDKYMYLPALRTDVLPPKPQDDVVVHKSPAYPIGRRYRGRGLNFRVCKHLLKVYEVLQTMRIESAYRKYPLTAPPSKIMNAEEWKRLMKFEFTEANIKQRLKADRPKIPAYFNRENLTQSVIDWFNQVWIPRNDEQKIKALRDLVEYPERIFFILMKEAYLKRSRGERISDRLINEAYSLMSRVVQPENKEEPQLVETEGPAPELGKGTGGIAPPGGDVPAADFIKADEPADKGGPSEVEPLVKPTELSPSTLSKDKPEEKETPSEKRKRELEERQKKMRERVLSDRVKKNLQKYKKEIYGPRKQQKKDLGQRPFFEE